MIRINSNTYSNCEKPINFHVSHLFYFVSLQKEDKTEPSKIDEIVGKYEGQTYYNSGWSLAGGNISKLNNDTIVMNYWRASTGDPIKMRIVGNRNKEPNIFGHRAHK